MRVPGQTAEVDELGAIVVRDTDGVPIRVRDVANVAFDGELRSGAATQNGREVVMSTVFMLIGENSRTVANAVAENSRRFRPACRRASPPLPSTTAPSLVDKTLATVEKNLIEGALLVVVVLLLLLGNFRAALLTAAVIPVAMLMTITGMVQTRVSANLMSLGALDFGLIVDGAVIIVENCLRRLSERDGEAHDAGRAPARSCSTATHEVIRPALFGVFIITAVYIPIFALTGVEGKMFHPMAITVVIALISAMILSVTFVPAGVALLFRKPVVEKENRLIRGALGRCTNRCCSRLCGSAGASSGAAVLCWSLPAAGWRRGSASEFVPNLDEGDIAMHALRIPGTRLEPGDRAAGEPRGRDPQDARSRARVREDRHRRSRDRPVPPSVADNFIILKPRDEWPDPDQAQGAGRA